MRCEGFPILLELVIVLDYVRQQAHTAPTENT